MLEDWKPLLGFEAYYEVSNSGRVRRIKAANGTRIGRILNPATDKDGYATLNLSCDGVLSRLRLGRAVALAFVPNPLGLPEVNHINLEKLDNYSANLEWVTTPQNQRTRSNVKLNQNAAALIREAHSLGVGLKKLTYRFNVSRAQVGRILRNESWA